MESNAKKTKKLCEALHAKDPGYRAAGNVDFALFIVGIVIVMLAVRAFIVEPVRVDGPSMMNTLQDGERCVVEKLTFLFSPPAHGDIVIIRDSEYAGQEKILVKRVIATAGQSVQLGSETKKDPVTGVMTKKYYVLIDGQRLDESEYEATLLYDEGYPNIAITADGAEGGVYVVPEGCIFVMGDHRTNSHDSRAFGAIPLSDVLGRVRGVIYPFSGIRSVG